MLCCRPRRASCRVRVNVANQRWGGVYAVECPDGVDGTTVADVRRQLRGSFRPEDLLFSGDAAATLRQAGLRGEEGEQLVFSLPRDYAPLS